MSKLINWWNTRQNWRDNTLTIWPQLIRKPWSVQYHESERCKFYDWWVFRVKVWKRQNRPSKG